MTNNMIDTTGFLERWKILPKVDPDHIPNLCEECPGWYEASNGKRYLGVGSETHQFFDPYTDEPMHEKDRIPMCWEPRRPAVAEEHPERLKYARLPRPIPEPGEEGHGGRYQFYDMYTLLDMPEKYMPSASYPEDPEAQQIRNKGKYTGKFPGYPNDPKLGTEDFGAYMAPNGQWYTGVGKVVKFGVNTITNVYTFVEPIPGKQGGKYDFFHPTTRDWMPDDQLPPMTPERIQEAQNNSTAKAEEKPDSLKAHGNIRTSKDSRKLYLGVGRVIETGTNDKGQIYVYVEPASGASQGKGKDRESEPVVDGHIYLNVEPVT
ncbi:hypothetical protein BJX76DRAFT_360527 [Aspergillus varians]